jgi:hypothetical protein
MRPIASKRKNKSPAKIQKLHKGLKINQLHQNLIKLMEERYIESLDQKCDRSFR